MHSDLKTKWVNALRSGEYQQSRQSLKNAKGFCCLGVLCDVMQVGEWKSLGRRKEDGTAIYELDVVMSDPESKASYRPTHMIPSSICDDIELEFEDQLELIDFNDHQNKSFEEIANYIEENL